MSPISKSKSNALLCFASVFNSCLCFRTQNAVTMVSGASLPVHISLCVFVNIYTSLLCCSLCQLLADIYLCSVTTSDTTCTTSKWACNNRKVFSPEAQSLTYIFSYSAPTTTNSHNHWTVFCCWPSAPRWKSFGGAVAVFFALHISKLLFCVQNKKFHNLELHRLSISMSWKKFGLDCFHVWSGLQGFEGVLLVVWSLYPAGYPAV